MEAAELLARDGFDLSVVNCRFVKPLDHGMLQTLVADHRLLVTVEDGTAVNGFGAQVAAAVEGMAPEVRVAVMGAPDRTFEHASRAQQLADAGLTAAGIADRVRACAGDSAVWPAGVQSAIRNPQSAIT
jgi:1-deoxy-D-xylulose-5-phosphate synthase